MSSRLTLAEARTQLYSFVNPKDEWDPEFLIRLNRVRERLINSGKWKGTKGVVDFVESTDGLLTLPRRYEAVLGYTSCDIPRPVYGLYHEYSDNGPGLLDETLMVRRGLVDMGEFPTMSPITADATIRLVRGNAADAAATVRLYGEDASGNPIFDTDGHEGITVTLSSASQDTTQVFSKLTAVRKTITVGTVALSQVVATVPTLLSTYEPTETAPLYRRYKCGITTEPIRCLCKRRFLLLTLGDETEIVLPGNLRALKLGLQAERFEVDNDTDRANTNWNMAFEALNEELREARGSIKLKLKLDLGRRVPSFY